MAIPGKGIAMCNQTDKEREIIFDSILSVIIS